MVNKPAGWHCQPNEAVDLSISKGNQKCLVTNLKIGKLGGGSDGTFLLPMHRIDQPCTGVVLLAKNTKAGGRVGKAWRDAKVCKDYYCVVEGYLTDLMSSSSTSSTNKNNDNDKIYELEGLLRQKNNNKSRSVTVKHLPRNFNKKTYQYNKNEGRYCRLEWSLIQPAVVTVNNDNACFNNEYNLICVRTNSGARHQVRAMLAQLGNVPIAGDLRYGSSTSAALGDISVALHARTLALPSVKLGDMDLSVPFVAPIPSSWKSFFGLKEADLPKQ